MNDDDNAQELLDRTTKELRKRLMDAEKCVITKEKTQNDLDTSKDALKVLEKAMEGINGLTCSLVPFNN